LLHQPVFCVPRQCGNWTGISVAFNLSAELDQIGHLESVSPRSLKNLSSADGIELLTITFLIKDLKSFTVFAGNFAGFCILIYIFSPRSKSRNHHCPAVRRRGAFRKDPAGRTWRFLLKEKRHNAGPNDSNRLSPVHNFFAQRNLWRTSMERRIWTAPLSATP
jgi:hypothetical protein